MTGGRCSFKAVSSSLVVPDREPCPYCENLAGRYAWHGKPAVIAEDGVICVFLAPAPMGGMPGHALVIPKRHVETIFDLEEHEEAAVARAVARTARTLRAGLDPEGVLIQQHNGVAAFQTVPHVHFHVIPKVPGPFPPLETPPVVPAAERAKLAAHLRRHWDLC